MTDEIKAIFSDGGVILRNPSDIGGTWAWCAVTEAGDHVFEMSGYLLPSHAPENLAWYRMQRPYVTNNETEFYAALRGLESMTEGWSGILASDSKITLTRIEGLMRGYRIDLPDTWALRGQVALAKIGRLTLRHVPGHPSVKDLRRGYTIREMRGPDGQLHPKQVRVSRHQVWCDTECRRLAKESLNTNMLVDTLAVGVAIMPSVEGSVDPDNNLDGALVPAGEAG